MPVCPNPDCANAAQARFMGHEVRGIYDGVLFWECLECGVAFPRDHGMSYRNIQSELYAEKHNLIREQESK